MASKSLSFLLFGEDVTASRAFRKVAAEAEASSAGIKSSFSKGSVLAVGGLVAGLGLAAKGAADFQTQMVRLVTAAGESQANLKLVSKGVLDISSATGTGLKATGDAMYYVESAGFHGAKGLEVLKAAAQGAKVEGADTQVVANALTTALTDLGKKAGPPALVMSQLVDTVAHGKMSMDDLAGSLHSVLPNAAAIGISLAQVGGALATMTAQGISADQAAQNLNHAILSLANPTAVQTNAMAALGLNSSMVAKNLGKQGLTGTLEELSNAVTSHMGPAGVTITKALNQSQIAAGKATEAYKAMTPEMKKYADEVIAGGKSTVTARQLGQGFDLAQKTQIQQWERLYKGAHGFSDLLKAKSPDALTYAAAMAKITGGQTGLQVALHLTGDNMATFSANVADISKTTTDAGGNVKDFAEKEKTLNQKLAELKVSASNAGVALGTDLIPKLTSAADFVLKHKKEFELFAVAIVGIKVAVAGVKLAQEGAAAVGAIYMGAQKLLGYTSATAAAQINAEAAAIERANLAKKLGGKIPGGKIPGGGGAPIIGPGKTGVSAAAAKVGLTGGVFTAITAPLITSGDTSQLQKWQTALDSLAKTYPNVRKLGVLAFGGLAQAMQKGTITVQEYKDALAAGDVKVAEAEAAHRHLGDAQRAQAQKAKDAKESQRLLNLALGATPKQVNTNVNVIAAMAKRELARVHSLLAGLSPKQIPISANVDWSSFAAAQNAISALSLAQTRAAAQGAGQSTKRGNAGGASFFEGGRTRINESGQEIIDLPRGTRIYPHGQTPPGGGMTVNVTVHAGMGTNGAQVGRQIVTALEQYSNQGGQMKIARAIT